MQFVAAALANAVPQAYNGIMVQGQWCIYGGLWTGEAYNSFYLFDFEKLAWTCVKLTGSEPRARYYHMATCHNQAMVVLGGETTHCLPVSLSKLV